MPYVDWAWLKRYQIVVALFALGGAIAFAYLWVNWLYPTLAANRGFTDRLVYWEVAWQTWRQYPIFGGGLDTHTTFYVLRAQSIPNDIFRAAHNWWMTILADLGLVGFTAALFLWGQTAVPAKQTRPLPATEPLPQANTTDRRPIHKANREKQQKKERPPLNPVAKQARPYRTPT